VRVDRAAPAHDRVAFPRNNHAVTGPAAQPRLLFRRAHRVTHAREFQAAYAGRVSRARGPLVIYGRLNGTPLPRLGLSVGRRVGNAVKRNRIKRLLREAFRLGQRDLPGGLDLIVNVRPHDELPLAQYQAHLQGAAASLARQLSARSKDAPDGRATQAS
jgi:ribonuclease P protein component